MKAKFIRMITTTTTTTTLKKVNDLHYTALMFKPFTAVPSINFHLSNLPCSALPNPRDHGAWRMAQHWHPRNV